MNNSIIHCKQDVLEFYIDMSDDRVFTSIRGYARMSGKAVSTISERYEGVREFIERDGIKTLKVPSEGGLTSVRVIDDHWIVEWLAKDNIDLLKLFAKKSVKGFAKQIAGIPEITSNTPQFKFASDTYPIDETLCNPFSIREFLSHYEIELSPGDFQALTYRVANLYRNATGRKRPPRKSCSISGSDDVYAYPAHYQSIVDSCLHTLLSVGNLSSNISKYKKTLPTSR